MQRVQHRFVLGRYIVELVRLTHPLPADIKKLDCSILSREEDIEKRVARGDSEDAITSERSWQRTSLTRKRFCNTPACEHNAFVAFCRSVEPQFVTVRDFSAQELCAKSIACDGSNPSDSLQCARGESNHCGFDKRVGQLLDMCPALSEHNDFSWTRWVEIRKPPAASTTLKNAKGAWSECEKRGRAYMRWT